MDIDAFNTSLMGRMASILMLEDSPYKWAYLKALSRWIDNGFKYVDGTMPCFKSDGSIYHHRKAYPAYAVGGLDGAVNSVFWKCVSGAICVLFLWQCREGIRTEKGSSSQDTTLCLPMPELLMANR